jgi:hypothetical protein
LTEFYLSGGDRGRRDPRWDAVALVSGVSLLTLMVRGGASVPWVIPWVILVLYVAAFHCVMMNRTVTNPWIATIGGMCYTIYRRGSRPCSRMRRSSSDCWSSSC